MYSKCRIILKNVLPSTALSGSHFARVLRKHMSIDFEIGTHELEAIIDTSRTTPWRRRCRASVNTINFSSLFCCSTASVFGRYSD